MLAMVEAVTTKHRPALCRPERDSRVLAADRADSRRGEAFPSRGWALRALTLARFAVFGFVREMFLREKRLFPSGPDEFRAARRAPESLVLELHRSSPQERALGSFQALGHGPWRPVPQHRPPMAECEMDSSPIPDVASSDCVSEREPALPGVCRPASGRTSAS